MPTPKKVTHIIEFQEGRQRNPTEALEFMRDEISKGACTHMLILYHNDETASFINASNKRDYKNSQILWDVEQYKLFLLGSS